MTKQRSKSNMKNRYQVFDSKLKMWIKHDRATNSVMQAKKNGLPFRRIDIVTIQ